MLQTAHTWEVPGLANCRSCMQGVEGMKHRFTEHMKQADIFEKFSTAQVVEKLKKKGMTGEQALTASVFCNGLVLFN